MGGSVSKSERLDGGGESTATARADMWPTRRRIEDVKRWRHARTRKDSIVSTTELLGPVEDPDAATNFSEDSPNHSTPPEKKSDDSIELLKERKDTKAEKDAKPVHVVAEHGSSTAAEEQREEEEEGKAKQAVVTAEEEGKRREEVEKKSTSEVENKVEPEVEKKVEEEERRGDERKGEEEEEEEEKEEEIRRSASFRFYFKQPESDEESVKVPWFWLKKHVKVDEAEEKEKLLGRKNGEENSDKKKNGKEHERGSIDSMPFSEGSAAKSSKKGKGRRLKRLTKAPSRVYRHLKLRNCYSHINASDAAAAASRRPQRLLSVEDA